MSKGMSLKGFVRKATVAKSAIGFLDAQKEFIRQHSFLAPTLEQYESGKVHATAALETIRDLAFVTMRDQEIENARVRSQKEPNETVAKPYTVILFHKDGSQIVEGDSESFDLLQKADGWADRRLVADASTVHAEILTTMIGKNNQPIKFMVMRQDAIARMLKAKRGPVTKGGTTSSSLGFKPKVKNDVSHFSRG